MEMIKRKKYILKILGWSFLVLFVLIIAAGVFVFFTAENYVNKHLSEWVEKKSNNLYQLSFENIQLKLHPFSISVFDISLTTDQKTANQLLEKSPEKMLYDFQSPKIVISNINLNDLIRKKSFRCKSINVYEPELQLKGSDILQADSAQVFDRMNNCMRVVRNKTRPAFEKVIGRYPG